MNQRLVRSPNAPAPAWLWIAAIFLSLVLFWVTIPLASALYNVSLPLAYMGATALGLVLPLSLKMPRTAVLLLVIVTFGFGLVSVEDGSHWPMFVPAAVASGALLGIIGLRKKWQETLLAWWLLNLPLTAAIVVTPGALDRGDDWGGDLIINAAMTLVVAFAGIGAGQRVQIREDLANMRRDIELEQARRRVVEERTRIARELHDVVAHTMSIVHMQAASAPYRFSLDEATTNEFDSIARSAREALGEMRHLLSALREENHDVDHAPQPTAGDIPRLVEGLKSAGHQVTTALYDGLDEESDVLQLTIYRIIQESLSNVVRHAPGSEVQISVRKEGVNVVLEISNAPPPVVHYQPPDAGGHGLIGMRERVALLHGSLKAGATPDGGFRVYATLQPAAST